MKLRFSFKAARLIIKTQGLDSPKRLRVLTDMNIYDICNITKKPGGKNSNEMSYRGWQVPATAQENLKLAVYLFHPWGRCTFDWEVLEV